MIEPTLADLQVSVQDKSAFHNLDDYATLCSSFLALLERTRPTRIVSPTHPNYIFYQYDETHSHRITRPLNTHLFIENIQGFLDAFDKCLGFLDDLKIHQEHIVERADGKYFMQSNIINKVVYTIQQSIGSVGDSFQNPNQSRKRIGQLFEHLIRLIIQRVGFECQSRTIDIPILTTKAIICPMNWMSSFLAIKRF